jgi:hypothetical protein
MTSSLEPAVAPIPPAPVPPTWLDILGAAAVAVAAAAWGLKVYGEQGLQAALGILCVAAWIAGFAAIRFATRRRLLAGRAPSQHQAGLERAHAFVGAMLFTYLAVTSATDHKWLSASGFLVAAIAFGLGGVRSRPA